MSKVVKAQSKGMVTIPIEYRNKLGITANSLLKAVLLEDGVKFIKITQHIDDTEIYSQENVQKWAKEDKLDKKTIDRLKKILN